tara:strand:+ start:27 stop:1778 length:1752 start_codon:yes stop_codon:yes gene_type:complete
MATIKKLNTNIINNIAAGEIIEGPSSVVKELIENSIDAKSKSIEIHIEDSGIKKIIIKDDGYGMSKKDLELAFHRHTTSKISAKKDLFNIKTLGFRGEALPSIASVSFLSAISKNKSDIHQIKIIGGKQEFLKKGTLNRGTLIKVENLFFNLPARKKFLKSQTKEFNKITSIVKSYALCYPDVSFKFSHNGKDIYDLESNSLENRIYSIFGKKFKESLITVDYEKDECRIKGVTGNIDLLRKRKVNQFIFLNNRLIKDKSIEKAILSPFLSSIQRNEYPFYVLNIEVPFDYVDVNVHPNKNEVRFKNKDHIYHIVKRAISNSIENIYSVLPSFYGQYDQRQEEAVNLDFRKDLINEIPDNIQEHFVNYDKIEDEQASEEAQSVLDKKDSGASYDYDIFDVWQIHNKYLLTEINGGLLIIDQHVAHERVLYESAKDKVESNGLESQTLLFPQYMEFQNDEFSYIVELFPYLNKLGFRIREFGENTIIVESSPIETPFGEEVSIIREILDLYIKYNDINSSFIDKMCATFSCKAAIKAGEKLEAQEMKHLINRLFLTKNPFYCPHGRPIIINLTEDELDERFERK